MSSLDSQSRDSGLDSDTSHNYVTVIQNEYSRNRGFPQPPDPYSDYSSPRNGEVQSGGEENGSSEGYKTLSESTNSQWERTEDSQSDQTPHSIKVCVYLMSDVAFHMELEDGANTTVPEMVQAIVNDPELGLPKSAANIFTMWMCSGLLELQLKPGHRPLAVRAKWPALLAKYAHATDSRQRRDEPVLSFQRNVFLPRATDQRIKDAKVVELLYHEARYNILEGRYPCEVNNYIMLGAIQARLELGPYNPQHHTIHFFREQQSNFLPVHMRRGVWTSWLHLSGKTSPEVKLLENFKLIPANTTERKLQRKYLEFCWSLPYYGCAFFQGQVEQPVRGLTSLITHQDVPVLVGINTQGVYIIDNVQCCLLLGLKYEDMSWDFAKPSQEDNPDCLPCLFLQFRVLENGTRVFKILQVFSKQAVMMDALISGFVEDVKRKASAALNSDETDRPSEAATDSDDTQMPLTKQDLPQASLGNKLSKLTLATFDEEGRCIGRMGSWSFTY
ncbi:putative FERM domain-containing protein FRMD8P1 isoform X2 [Nilaparvata lugens]|uniref:putative FERM domain-containing protein FRMD8P1 isoform X2 n=1 Tax=Nilaparvata lugens TaxID=108931 RepID=UPI000B9968CB|nr:putative FERM domain-containing protein FRMD8P1 isoform X2 [Nilaparvata lugens]